jgi:diguanylate cyclase (GGDEF)-like protein
MPASLPSALLFVSCGMIWNAARLFQGRNVLWLGLFAGAAIWMSGCALPAFTQMSSARVVLASLIVSAYAFLSARELWRERRKPLIRRWRARLVPVLHGAVFLFPIALASLMPDERGLVTLATGWMAVLVLEMLLYAVGTAFVVLSLAKERALSSHKAAALTDPLTGLFNRRGLLEATRGLAEQSSRLAQPISVLAFDLDHFKSINDRFGHAVGDDVLKLFASVASTSMRATDVVCRLGGEEFVAIIPGSLDDAIAIAERVRVAFEAAACTVSGRYVGATVSVGVASHEAATNIDALLARADTALYAAKAGGRNRVATDKAPVDVSQADAHASDATANTTPDNTIEWTSYRRPQGAASESRAA